MSAGPASPSDDSRAAEASFELTFTSAPRQAPTQAAPPGGEAEALHFSLLATNTVWFCYLRWVILAIFMVFGLLGIVPGLFASLGLRPPGVWPFAVAAILAITNICYLTAIRRMTPTPDGAHTGILWVQIILDLLVLTAVIYFVGSMRTYVPFAYLFHIALACIFFSHRQSLAVALIACVLYTACITALNAGLLPPTHLFIEPAAGLTDGQNAALPILNFLTAIGIWLVVWYLVSHLTTMVWQRDARLATANERLRAAMSERRRHMLTTTHQLKSPFAAIQANTQLLLGGYCGTLPAEAVAVTERIAARCRALAAEIQEMVQLANLSSTSQHPLPRVVIDLPELLRWCMSTLEPSARSRRISFQADLSPATAFGAEDHLKMLLANLLSNAVIYSYDGGLVRLTCRGTDCGAVVTVADEGIGIPPEKLPRIFEEHYRTNEAVKHNKQSTGLGLAIVRHVAERYGIAIRVTSRPDHGTAFEVLFPPITPGARQTEVQENEDGLSDDRG